MPTSRPVGVATQLSAVVEAEVIPRLMLAHPAAADAAPTPARPSIPTSPQAFTRIVLDRDASVAGAFVATALREGAEPESLYEHLLAPTALLLADLWRDDRLSYTEVTIGLARLQQLVRALPGETAYNGENDPEARSALFAPRPGEQQTFGFYMLEETFRWGGWRTWIETTSTADDLVANVGFRWFDMVCLSVSRPDDIAELSEVVGAIRRASRNPDVVITIDGTPFSENPDWVSTVGAGAVASRHEGDAGMADRDQRRLATA